VGTVPTGGANPIGDIGMCRREGTRDKVPMGGLVLEAGRGDGEARNTFRRYLVVARNWGA
jgi:hypothetical protein